MSVTVYIGPGPPCQADGFSDGAERSVKGALYFRPNSLATITRDELEHVQHVHPEINVRLRVVRVDEPPLAVEEGSPEVIALPPVEDASDSEVEPEGDVGTRAKSRSSRSRKTRTDSD